MHRFHPGQRVVYRGELYYVLGLPLIGAGGFHYTISITPPPIQGIPETELSPAPAVDDDTLANSNR